MNISISTEQIVVWVVIGVLAGSLAAMFIKSTKKGMFSNLIVGLVGALLGGFLFDLLNINLGLGKLTITFEDLIAAFVGSIIFLILLSFIRK
jgi:uncharacterized membrane protein YeaQ/YmgE (transglycosylase-associated protein family)